MKERKPHLDGNSGFRGCAVEPASGLAPTGINPGRKGQSIVLVAGAFLAVEA